MSSGRRSGSLARHRMVGKALVATMAVVLLAGSAGLVTQLVRRANHLTDLEAAPPGSTVPVRPFGHVFLIVLENKTEGDIVGSPQAPHLADLIARYGLATRYQAIAHPSQPNYLALFSGSTQDVLDDAVHDVAAPNLADQLETADRTWRVYAENLPSGNCFAGESSTGGHDGSGEYVRRHNPAISFGAIRAVPARCANIRPLAEFRPDAADFTMIIPNGCHAMHDCPVASGDAWLGEFLPRIFASPAWRDGGVLFITFDEGSDRSSRNEVPTLVIAPDVPPGFRSDTPHSHYSLLRTIEDGFGLPCLAHSCDANTLGEFFVR